MRKCLSAPKDQYLYLHRRLAAPADRISDRGRFESKLETQRYVKEFFPDANIAHFFDSFSWRIPSGLPGHMNPVAGGLLHQLELKVQPESDPDIGGCKAGRCAAV
ncbi:hypothetical protein KIW84_065610 [Lathyrus oleraceus]|uniref:DUF7081 domain-containing protein n=1 Tax=Pisum sativum TaxID=3888 RepID=A0A9D4WDI1_PEA|nr:hypothetical protein KIW84_065610 [Pisum sativum]